MENYDITALREWAPLTEVLEKIPSRIQKGLFSTDLNVTCIDVISEFIALGTDAGIVFWYNRFSGEVQKLRAEVSTPLTCIKVVSTVEYMVAAGSTNGQVSVFQIQKEVPQDLNLVVPLTKSKPIERYTIRDLHKSFVTCCEWSKNGMRLFSGDKQGVVVQTEFDYQAHLSKSIEILNEAYEIVQLNVFKSYLIVSTIYRSIVCKREQVGGNNSTGSGPTKWKISQIGKKDRKILHEFGAAFRDRDSTASPNAMIKITSQQQVVCSRPGLRLWLADVNGNVEQTLLYKDTVTAKPLWVIPLLNPSKNQINKCLVNFGKILMFSRNYVITYDETTLLILNIDKLRVEAMAKGFRKILDVVICGKEIFVLEGSRSLIRISTCPEPPSKTAQIIFNPFLPPPVPGLSLSIFESPIEFEPEDDVINAEECFELPSTENIDVNIPIQTNIDSPTTQKNKLIMEQSRRFEVFDKINEMEFDDSILYRSGIGKKHKKDGKRKSKSGIVEIGRTAKESPTSLMSSSLLTNSMTSSSTITEIENKSEQETFQTEKVDNEKVELTTKPLLMEASFCGNDNFSVPDLLSPDTLKRVLQPKEQALAKELDLEPIKFTEISEEELKMATKHNDKITSMLPVLQYPLNYPLMKIEGDEIQTTPRKKLHFIQEYDNTIENSLPNTADTMNLCDELSKSVMIQSDCTNNTSCSVNNDNNCDKMIKSLQFVKCTVEENDDVASGILSDVPDIKLLPEFMKIPSLWNDKIETVENEKILQKNKKSGINDDSEQSDSQTSGDWEFVD